MIEYAGTYLKNQSIEYTRIILNVSDAVHSNKITVQFTEQLPRQMERFGKRIMPAPGKGEGDCETRAIR